ncbi:MAG: hypothetical protein R2932_46615 [Caldilineaceae bacterium]
MRVNAANLLTAWLAGDPTGVGDPDALIIGDLNSYAMEDPITAIKGADYTNWSTALVVRQPTPMSLMGSGAISITP